MSIREHGGAVRYWRHKVTGARAVECRDGATLFLHKGRWYSNYTSDLQKDQAWAQDTRREMSAAITRTNRDARRRDV